MNLVDIGANLAHDSFDSDRDDVIQRAKNAGVDRMILTGSSVDSNPKALEIAESYEGRLYSTAGVHPHHASEYNDSADTQIRQLASQETVVAIGECGLDFYRNFAPADAQIEAFARQLDIAVDLQMPVFLHQRDAHEAFVEILEPYLDRIPRGVAHCFTGQEQELRRYIELGLYIGITGWICDERRGQHLKDIVGLIPNDRLMVETDAPYLMPRSLDPKPATRRNEPRWLTEVIRVIAESLDEPVARVAARTTANAERFFALPSR